MSLGDAGLALLRFTQVCCRDICLFQPLPWFAAASSLQNMGSNARAGFLDLLEKFGRGRFRGRPEACPVSS